MVRRIWRNGHVTSCSLRTNDDDPPQGLLSAVHYACRSGEQRWIMGAIEQTASVLFV